MLLDAEFLLEEEEDEIEEEQGLMAMTGVKSTIVPEVERVAKLFSAAEERAIVHRSGDVTS